VSLTPHRSPPVLVETAHKAPPPAPEPELPTGPRAGRAHHVEIAAESLQLVETHKEPPPPPA
jgi:hypothetical protein